jgi:hypothetical protein
MQVSKILGNLQQWPKQVFREKRFDLYLEQKQIGPEERVALTALLNNEISKKYPLNVLKEFLPNPKVYKLLDKEGQSAIARRRSPFAMLKGYLFDNDKLRR